MPLPPTYKFRSISTLIGLYTKFGSDPPAQGWSMIHAQMAIYFAERMPE